MIQAIQQLQQDMEPWKLACMAGLILSAVVYCWLGARQENARMRALARAEVRPYLAYAVDEIERMGEMVQDHDRALSVLTQDPEQEAIDAAIAEADAEAEEAHEHEVLGRRVIA